MAVFRRAVCSRVLEEGTDINPIEQEFSHSVPKARRRFFSFDPRGFSLPPYYRFEPPCRFVVAAQWH